MFKKRMWLGIILSIIFLIFSINGSTAYYKYTQESGDNFYVGTDDKADALEDTNEMRQILDDLGNLLGHTKRNDEYPKDGTTGGTLVVPLNFTAKEENTSNIIKGQAIYISGAIGAAFPKVGLADGKDAAKIRIVGLAAEDITQNGLGLIRRAGLITGVATLGATPVNPNNETWEAGDLLYVDDTAGGLTNVKPTSGRIVKAAYSLYGSSNTDDLLVITHENPVYLACAPGEDIVLRMGDSAGTNKILFKDYLNNIMGFVDSDGNIDGTSLTVDTAIAAAEGGTGKASWTLYAIPYLSGTTTFGEIPIGTAGQVLKVAVGATGYEFGDVGNGAATFVELTDTPASYTGKAGEILQVNATPNAVEFSGVAIETTLTVGSDAKIPTSKAVNDFCETTKDYMQNLVEDTTPELGSDLDLNTHNIYIGAELTSDHTYSGLTDSQVVGESVVFGDLLYPDWTTKKWKKADADTAATMPGLRIALESKIADLPCYMLIMGYIRDDDWNFTGAMIYASTTAGGVTSTAPSAAGQQLQRIGICGSANVILFFDPSIDVGEIKP